MKILIDYKPPCNIDILSEHGTIDYISKIMSIVVLETNKSIDDIKEIDGVVNAYEDRAASLY